MITDDEAREMRAKAMEQDDHLTGFGIGNYDPRRFTIGERREKLEENRKEFLLDRYLEQIKRSVAWIQKQPIMKQLNRRSTSYGYKHEVENWSRSIGEYLYVSNGAFIAAALGLGVRGKVCAWDSPNYFFAFSSSKEVRKRCLGSVERLLEISS